MLFAGRLQKAEDLSELFSLGLIGTLLSNGFTLPFEKLVKYLSTRRYGAFSVEKKIKMTAAKLKIMCESKGIKSIVLSGTASGNNPKLLDRFKAELDALGIKTEASGDILKDTEVLKKAAEIGKNPDWYCSFCNSLNSDKVQVCGTCGASRADSEANYFQMLEKNKAKEADELAAQPHPDESQKKRPKWLLFAALAVVALLVYLLWPKTIKGQVTAVNWTRNIAIESNQPFRESSEPPSRMERWRFLAKMR